MHLIFGISFSILILIILKPFLVKYVNDMPIERSSHEVVVPTGGGLIFSLPILTYALFNNKYYLLSLLPLIIIGFIDDIFKVSSLIRALIQLLSIFLVIQFIDIYNPFINQEYLIIFSISLGVTLINLFNFMDGLDGLLSGCFLLILSRSIYAISPELSILLGSLFVFFIFNWSPAKIFMGDTGSTFLGGIYFIILLNSSNISGFFINLLISTPLLLDSLTCIMIRLFKKQNIFKPHKKHLYQRLNQAGFKHSTVSLIYILATLFLVVFSTFNNILYLIMACIAIVFVGFYLNAKYAIEFN